MDNGWFSHFQVLTFPWNILPKNSNSNNNNKIFCYSKSNNKTVPPVSTTAEFIAVAICEVLIRLELKKTPNSRHFIYFPPDQNKKHLLLHKRPSKIFFRWCSWAIWPTMFTYINVYKLRKFPVNFIWLKHGLPSCSYGFTLIVFMYTSNEGVLWLLISWKIFLNRRNIVNLQISDFHKTDVNKTNVNKTNANKIINKAISRGLSSLLKYKRKCRFQQTE